MRELPPTSHWGFGPARTLVVGVALLVTGTMVPRAASDGPIVPASLPLALRSSAVIPALLRVTPAVTDRLVALATADGPIEARSLDDPSVIAWRYPLSDVLGLAAGDGLIYVATATGVTALDAETGKTRWTHDDKAQGATLMWRRDVLFVSASDGTVTALRTTDGSRIWQTRLSAAPSAPPSSDGDVIVTSLVDRHIVALSTADGHQVWSSALNPISSTAQFPILTLHVAPAASIPRFVEMPFVRTSAPGPPLAANGRVYVFGDDGALYFLNAKTGVFKRPTGLLGGRKAGAPAADARHVFLVTVDGLMASYDSANGALEYRQPQKSAARFGPFVDRGIVFVPLDSGDVQGLLSETLGSVAKLSAPPTLEPNAQLSVAPVTSGTGQGLRIVTITDTSQSWSMAVYGKAHLTTTPLRIVPGRPLPPSGSSGRPAPR